MAQPAHESPHLDEGEKEKAQEHSALTPMVVHEIVRAEGKAELERTTAALLWSGLAAGLSMGFSFVTQALLRQDLGSSPGARALSCLGYMVGFAIVVLGRQQLFTESTLTALLPAIHDRKPATFAATGRVWFWVLLANLVGTWIFAAALAFGHPLPPDASASLIHLAGETVSQGFWNTLLRSILAGWLIALMVWLLPSTGSARILIIALLTWLVAFAKLSHIVAGSTESAYGVLMGIAGIGDYAWRFLLPTFLGNTIGGVALVALLNHAPVAEEVSGKTKDS